MVWADVLTLENPLEAESFTELVNNIAGFVFKIATPLATLVFLWGGFLFMFSGGDEQKVTKAKQLMLWAAIGLIICLIGTGFTSILKELLEGGPASSPPPATEVPEMGETEPIPSLLP